MSVKFKIESNILKIRVIRVKIFGLGIEDGSGRIVVIKLEHYDWRVKIHIVTVKVTSVHLVLNKEVVVVVLQ